MTVAESEADRRLAWFVDRDEASTTIAHLMKDRTGLSVVDLQGVQGSGKSLLLRRLQHQHENEQDAAVALIAMGEYVLPASVDRPADDAGEASGAEARHRKFCQLLIALAAQLGRRDPSAFAGLADAAASQSLHAEVHGAEIQEARVVIGSKARVSAAGDIVGLKIEAPIEAKAAFEFKLQQLTDALLDGIVHVARHRCPVVLLDDFDKVIDQEIGSWILTDVLARLDRGVVVVARAASSHDLPGRPAAEHLSLSNLQREHVIAYLQKRLPPGSAVKELAEAILEFSGGHPHAVSLAADLIKQRGSLSVESLLETFASLPADRTGHMRRLVDEIVAGVDDPGVVTALELAWVARRVDAGLLRALLYDALEPSQDPDRFGRLIDALSTYSFTEPCADAGAAPAWHFHEFIREERDSRLASRDPDRYVELHRRCAEYFAQRMNDADAASPVKTSYARAALHDALAWQILGREWLYHLAHLADRRDAGVSLARMYLGIFYWYGWYEPYSLCDRLLEDWDHTQSDVRDRRWARLLRRFAKSYPIVWAGQEPDWDGFESVVHALRDLAGIDELAVDPQGLSREQRRLRALTSMFIAQSHLRRIPPQPIGDVYYEDARMVLSGLDEDRWLLPWVAFWLGQAALERNELPRATEECDDALGLGAEQRDLEAVASAWQFRGDIRWRRRQFAAAVRAYVVSIGYAFQFLGLPFTPDPYTRTFFDEMTEGAVKRIRALWRQGDVHAALDACDAVRAQFDPVARALKAVPTPPDFSAMLAGGSDAALRSALLLDLPATEIQQDDDAVDRALLLTKRLIAALEQADATDLMAGASAPGATRAGDGPQRLRWDLHADAITHSP